MQTPSIAWPYMTTQWNPSMLAFGYIVDAGGRVVHGLYAGTGVPVDPDLWARFDLFGAA